MRGTVPVNLASEAFRRDRPVIALGIAAGAALLGLLVFQVALAWLQRAEVAESRQAVERTQRQLLSMGQEQTRLEATLREAKNAAAIEESVFFNSLIQRKAISWTRIFADLEQVVPHNVRLISIRPQVNQDNQIVLEMVVGSQNTEPVIEMLMRLEGSPLFGATAVSSWLPPSQSEPLYRYRLSANYDPKL